MLPEVDSIPGDSIPAFCIARKLLLDIKGFQSKAVIGGIVHAVKVAISEHNRITTRGDPKVLAAFPVCVQVQNPFFILNRMLTEC